MKSQILFYKKKIIFTKITNIILSLKNVLIYKKKGFLFQIISPLIIQFHIHAHILPVPLTCYKKKGMKSLWD